MSRNPKRTDVYPDDRLSSFLLDVRYIATFGRGSKEGQAGEAAGKLRPASTSQSGASVGSNLIHDSSDKRHRRRT